MQLYFSPMACSMATRIALYEAGASATFTQVDGKTKLAADGQDLRALNPLGMVPVLRTDSGDVLTENAAILQYVAAQLPGARLAPSDARGRVQLQQWLSFIGSELHKVVFGPLLDPAAPEAVKAYAVQQAPRRLEPLSAQLAQRSFLLDEFSVADAYLVTVLGWSVVTPIDLKSWPVLAAYVERLQERPSVARALNEERELYLRSQQR